MGFALRFSKAVHPRLIFVNWRRRIWTCSALDVENTEVYGFNCSFVGVRYSISQNTSGWTIYRMPWSKYLTFFTGVWILFDPGKSISMFCTEMYRAFICEQNVATGLEGWEGNSVSMRRLPPQVRATITCGPILRIPYPAWVWCSQ
jgi:hypothetical protein